MAPVKMPMPAGMADAYVFLASQEASYITAEIINASGGTPLPSDRRSRGHGLRQRHLRPR